MNKLYSHKPALRKSNAILIFAAISILSLLCSFVGSVRYKLGHDQFSYINNDKSLYDRHPLETRKTIVIHDVRNCLIVMSDSIHIEVPKGDIAEFEYKLLNDSIEITQSGKTSGKVFLYVPSGSRLVLNRSVITLKGSLDFIKQSSFEVVLRESELYVSADNAHTFFEHLKVSGFGKSQLSIADFVHIRNLEVRNITDTRLSQSWQIGNFKTAFGYGSEMTKQGDSLSIVSE